MTYGPSMGCKSMGCLRGNPGDKGLVVLLNLGLDMLVDALLALWRSRDLGPIVHSLETLSLQAR